MKNSTAILERLLRRNGKGSLKIQYLPGSSSADVFQCGEKIYKVGPIETALKEIAAYNRFADLLPDYNSIFPSVQFLTTEGKISIWEVEFVGSESFEEALLSLNHAESKGIGRLEILHKEVLVKIRQVFNATVLKTMSAREQESGLFFRELMEALKVNLKKAGFPEVEIGKANQLEIFERTFVGSSLSSLIHKDFSVSNIIVGKQDSVRFIDPREAVPYLEHSKAIGNVAFDLVGYYVSVLRKEMELQRNNPNLSLGNIIHSIEQEIESYKRENIFSKALEKLCLAVWYSVYSACKCEYCTSPERKWLYDEMVNRLRLWLEELNTMKQ